MNNKIPKKITEAELFDYYLKEQYDEFMDFDMFKSMVVEVFDYEIIDEEK